MGKLTLSDVERRLEELPLLPSVVAKLLALSPNDENYFEEVLRLAKEDPPFALRVIRLSNAANSSPATAISDIQRAVVRVGANQIAGLIASMAVMRVFFPTTQREKNMWVHAIRTAVAAKTIARMMPGLKVDPEQAYLCGLLADVGRFVLMDMVPKKGGGGYQDKNDWVPSRDLIDIEMDIYGFDHAKLGGRVCKKWNMPEVVTTVVTNHHQFELIRSMAADTKMANMIRVVQAGDAFGAFLMLNPDARTWDSPKLLAYLDVGCVELCCSEPPVSPEQLEANIDRVMEESDKIVSGLGIAIH